MLRKFENETSQSPSFPRGLLLARKFRAGYRLVFGRKKEYVISHTCECISSRMRAPLCVRASACFYEYRGKRSIITKYGCRQVPHAHVPPPFLARVPLVSGWSRSEKFVSPSARGGPPVPSLLFLPSFTLPPIPTPFVYLYPLSAYIVEPYTAFVTRLRNNPLARRGTERSSGVVQPVTSRIYE